jgi:hypothetical protein
MASATIILTLLAVYFILIYLIFNRWVGKSDKKWVSNVSYIRLVNEVILFASTIDNTTRIKRLPAVKISYHPHKKWGGSYNQAITIYKKNIKGVNELVSIVLHEYCHHLQYKRDVRRFDRMYSELNKSIGYDSNPLEVEARKYGELWTNPCIQYLAEKGIIKIKDLS